MKESLSLYKTLTSRHYIKQNVYPTQFNNKKLFTVTKVDAAKTAIITAKIILPLTLSKF